MSSNSTFSWVGWGFKNNVFLVITALSLSSKPRVILNERTLVPAKRKSVGYQNGIDQTTRQVKAPSPNSKFKPGNRQPNRMVKVYNYLMTLFWVLMWVGRTIISGSDA